MKGCDGTSYCSSESWQARANADLASSGRPEPCQTQAIHSSIRRYILQAVDQQVLEQEAVGTGIADRVGRRPSLRAG